MQLQARYTDDYPDVIKTKADIAEVEKKTERSQRRERRRHHRGQRQGFQRQFRTT
jgi:hypothetical protein